MRLCPRTILSIEDSSDEIFFLQNAFDTLGYGQRVYFARDGSEAVNYISGTGIYSDRTRFPLPCIVLTDLKMPGMDGFELLKWLRTQSPCPNLPAFVLSSSGLQQDKEKAHHCGANGYFTKPNEIGSLPEVLTQMESHWNQFLSSCTGRPPRLCD